MVNNVKAECTSCTASRHVGSSAKRRSGTPSLQRPENGNQILLYQRFTGAYVVRESFFAACDGKPFPIPAAPGAYRLFVISVGFQRAASAESAPRSFGTAEFHVAEGENREVEMKLSERANSGQGDL